ncbi:MAG TPA: Ku protein [Burkholderiales bacterium]|nr:Ku protein [Burkholderiales bacterium]
MPRALWKGAISFGLVHIPVALYPAAQEDEINFDWLDKRSMDPVGYKRVNKRTGKEIDKENIVKGVERAKGQYVVLSDEDIKAAYPKTTQTIEIEGFVDVNTIPFLFLERPYYLAPSGKGSDKVYALLREAMLEAGRVGVARVVLHNKQHLAALIPTGPALVLNTLRWPTEIRALEEIDLPPAGKSAAGLKAAELKMAQQLVKELSVEWKPKNYKDNFREAIMTLVEQKAKAGKTESVEALETIDDTNRSNVIDLTALLKQSLGNKNSPARKAPEKAAKKKTVPKRKSA